MTIKIASRSKIAMSIKGAPYKIDFHCPEGGGLERYEKDDAIHEHPLISVFIPISGHLDAMIRG